MIIQILTIILFIILGTMLSLGKLSFLITGFNTLIKKEKKDYDVLSSCKLVGKHMFMIAF